MKSAACALVFAFSAGGPPFLAAPAPVTETPGTSASEAPPPGSDASAPAEQLPPAAVPPEDPRRVVGPSAGAPTIALAQAVSLALERNLALLDASDNVSGARWQEQAERAAFIPRLTPLYQRSDERSMYGLDLAQELPWLGATVTGTGRLLTDPRRDAPFPRTTDLRILLTQPLLRGLGPNASLFSLRNARRARLGQERSLALLRERVAIEVTRSFYEVIAFRQLLDVARQSLQRSEALLRSSQARLEVGMASKLDVFRAQLKTAQAQEARVRAETALAGALERFRGVLALPPGDLLEPQAAALPASEAAEGEPVEALVARALARRLDLQETREQVEDARRASSLARQNLLPQLDLNTVFTQLGYGSSFSNAWTAGDRRFEVFLSASYPLQQPRARAGRALAELQLRGRDRALRQKELEVEQEVRQAWRELEQIAKTVELQAQAVEVAAQQRRLAVLRYERGLASNFEVVEAEGYLVSARSALVQSLTSRVVARLELLRTTGSLDLGTEFQP